MIKKLKKYWEILIILFLGLTPLLWYKNPSSLALGHDMGFPVDPLVFFKDRLFLWTERVGLGWDQTLGSAAVLIHGLEALISSLGLSIFTTQKFVFIFWFVLPGLAMYYFISALHKDKSEWFIRLSASLIYMFNHFLLQGWFIAERTKISLLVALPIILGLVINMIEKRMSIPRGLALISLTFFIFNGGGGLPLYGGMLLTVSLAVLFFGFIQLKGNLRAEIKRLTIIVFGVIGSFVLANFYWILPTAVNMLSSYKQSLISIGGLSGVLAWSFEISKFASILNVIRLQGIPDWYNNPSHPYSRIFLDNPLLILTSFLIPIIVFSSLFLVKKHPQYRRYVIFFNLLAILGIIFTAGSHPPFGVIYNFFLSFIPGFAIFRTPFYKFAPALWLAYAYLFAFSFYYLTEKLKKIKIVLRLIILPLILIYSFPFFTGSFFNWNKPFSTMVNLPFYVLPFEKWINSNLSYNDRVISFPQQNLVWNTAIYKWGYWSTAPLPSLFTDRSIVTNDKVMTTNERLFINDFYDSIIKGTPVWNKISQLMGINYFLLQNDFYSDEPRFETGKPNLYKEKFTKIKEVTKVQSFGQWDLYRVASSNPKKLFLSSNTSLLLTKNDLNDQLFDINSIFFLPNSESENFYITNEAEKKNIPTEYFSRIILLESCLYCDRKEKEIDLEIRKPQILPGSIFYQFVEDKEQEEGEKVKNDISKLIDYYLGISLKRIGEAKQLVLLKEKDENIILVLEEIKQSSKKITDILNKMDKRQVATRLEILKVDNFLRGENRALNDIAQESNGNIRNQISLLRDYIAGIYQKNNSYEFVYPADSEKHYNLSIQTPGNYEILLQRQDFGQELSFEKIILDGKEIRVKPVVKNSYYFSVGKIFLSEGVHSLKFEIGKADNLLKDIGDFSITKTDQACKTIVANKIYPDQKYIFSVSYITEGGGGHSGSELNIGQFVNNKEVLPSKVQLGAASISQSFSTDIVTQDKVNKLKISFCHAPGYESRSLIKIYNLRLEPVIMPAVAAVLDNSLGENPPDYSINRIDQTKYKVSVRGAKSSYFLVLNNTFNSNWKVFFDDTKKTLFKNLIRQSIPEENHIMVNGYSNGWIIDKTGDYSITIEYNSQRYYYYGWIVTALFMVISILYLVYKIYENRR